MTDNIRVFSSQNGGYDIYFVSDISALTEKIACHPHPILFIDASIRTHFPNWTTDLNGMGEVYVVEVREHLKSLTGATEVLTCLSEAGCGRHSTVVVIGGGVLADTVSFAAHIYHRGVRTVLVPTTLLAMCDSSMGGKCALNFEGHKNQLGAFHPPAEVILWEGFLNTLPDEAMYSGAGELLKYALMGGSGSYEMFKKAVIERGIRQAAASSFIHQGLMIKKGLVESDELDATGERKRLNYGHSFGHAIEQATAHRIPHGVAVAWGIDLANFVAFKRNLLSSDWMQEIHAFISGAFPGNVFAGLSAQTLIDSARRDKKNGPAGVDMVLLSAPGKLQVETVALDGRLTDTVDAYLNQWGHGGE